MREGLYGNGHTTGVILLLPLLLLLMMLMITMTMSVNYGDYDCNDNYVIGVFGDNVDNKI